MKTTWTNETGLVKAIVKVVKREYPRAWVFKVHGGPMQMAGVPDLIFIVDGLFIGAEAKFPHAGESVEHARSRATALQRNQIALINAAGGIAAVVVSPEETLDLIRRGFEKQEHVRADRLARSRLNEGEVNG